MLGVNSLKGVKEFYLTNGGAYVKLRGGRVQLAALRRTRSQMPGYVSSPQEMDAWTLVHNAAEGSRVSAGEGNAEGGVE